MRNGVLTLYTYRNWKHMRPLRKHGKLNMSKKNCQSNTLQLSQKKSDLSLFRASGGVEAAFQQQSSKRQTYIAVGREHHSPKQVAPPLPPWSEPGLSFSHFPCIMEWFLFLTKGYVIEAETNFFVSQTALLQANLLLGSVVNLSTLGAKSIATAKGHMFVTNLSDLGRHRSPSLA